MHFSSYCNILIGSISQGNFIALKIQYIIFNSSNTPTTSTGSLTQPPIKSAPNNVRALQALPHNSPSSFKNLSLIYHIAVSIVMSPFKLLCDCNKHIVMLQDCYVTMEMQQIAQVMLPRKPNM
jgi:hypothetical protein